jgi:hypothetical protein
MKKTTLCPAKEIGGSNGVWLILFVTFPVAKRSHTAIA